MRTSESINEISTSLAKFQSETTGAEQGAVNPHFKSKYSTLEDIWNSIRVPLGKNGLSILQELTNKESSVAVTTLITHSGGQWIEFGPLEIPYARKDAHAIGSAGSYAKRYALCAAVGVVSSTEDDDGNASLDKQKEKPKLEMMSDLQVSAIQMELKDDEALHMAILDGYGVFNLKAIEAKHFNAILKRIQERKGK